MNILHYLLSCPREEEECGLSIIRFRTRSPLIKDHYTRDSAIGERAEIFETPSGSQDRFNEYNKRFNGATIISNSSRIEKDSARRPCRSSRAEEGRNTKRAEDGCPTTRAVPRGDAESLRERRPLVHFCGAFTTSCPLAWHRCWHFDA